MHTALNRPECTALPTAKIKTAPDQGQCSMPTNSGTLDFAIVVYIFNITFCAYGTRHGEVQDMEYLSGGKDTGRGGG